MCASATWPLWQLTFSGWAFLQVRIAGGGVARVADGVPSRQALNNLFGEDLFHMPHALLADQVVAVGRGNAGALLAAMLKGIKSQIGEFGGFRVSIDPKNATMIVELINIKLITWEELGGWLQ